MKKTLFIFVLFSLMTSRFIQTVEAHNPPPRDTIYLIVNKHIIPLDRRFQMADFNLEWIKSVKILKSDKYNTLEIGKLVIIPKKRF